MSNSSLSCMRVISPFRNSPRNHDIDTITIHCVVGQMSVEGLCSHFQTANCSCNYGIGYDGRRCTIVDERDRSWCSSSPENDHRAITIECASDAFYPYAINANVWNSLVELCADICKRNHIKTLIWSTDKETRMYLQKRVQHDCAQGLRQQILPRRLHIQPAGADRQRSQSAAGQCDS